MTPPSATPQRYRFVVRSAEEAITVLRERLGPGAKVVSVQQVEGEGLARFLQSPKLEVIAELPAAAAAEPEFVPPDEAAPPRSAGIAPVVPAAVQPAPQMADEAPGVSVQFSAAAQAQAAPAPRPSTSDSTPESNVSPLVRLLRATGLPKSLLSRLQSEAAWPRWEVAVPAVALREIGHWLRHEWRRRTPAPLGQRIAFLGSPGAGKTTALCKRLALDVFCHQKRAVVLKLDLTQANPSDGLAVVCEAFGAVFARDLAEVPDLGPGDMLYVDVPGVSPLDSARTFELREALDPLRLHSRIVVANAAYEPELLKRVLAWGADVGCSHAIFTHLDELTHWGKLWEFVLHPQLSTLSLGTGQNIAGDAEENVFDAILERTLPRADAETGAHTNAPSKAA